MVSSQKSLTQSSEIFPKCPSGIRGLDEITFGGLPRGRTSLVTGGPGSGKTLMSMEFLVRGAVECGEPGVFMAFEETQRELEQNVASLGYDLKRLVDEKKISIDHVRVERNEIQETGEYDLEGLFIRLNQSIDSIGAKRVVLDTIESLFAGLSNESILRAELRRLFRWLKDKGVTSIITAERGQSSLTRYGLEEYVSDCVILLDHRVQNQISTRRLRIVKYRGSVHGTNEYPFLIDEHGVSVLPITSLTLDYQVSKDRVSSGIPKLDAMLDGKGFFRGSTILVSGTAGTGKTSMAASFANSVCKRGEKCMFFVFEESPAQIIRNLQSIGIELEAFVKEGRLKFQATRPTFYGIETHLVQIQKGIEEFRPAAIILDPVTNLTGAGEASDVRYLLMRLIDYLRTKQITVMLTNLSRAENPAESTESEFSSMVDTWIFLRDIELGGVRKRGIYVLKSRGMSHSAQIREFKIASKGIEILDLYPGAAEKGLAKSSKARSHKRGKTLRK